MRVSGKPTRKAMRVNVRVTQLLKADRSKGCLYLNIVGQYYLKWVPRLKCETRKARRLFSPSKEAFSQLWALGSIFIGLPGLPFFAPVGRLNG